MHRSSNKPSVFARGRRALGFLFRYITFAKSLQKGWAGKWINPDRRFKSVYRLLAYHLDLHRPFPRFKCT